VSFPLGGNRVPGYKRRKWLWGNKDAADFRRPVRRACQSRRLFTALDDSGLATLQAEAPAMSPTAPRGAFRVVGDNPDIAAMVRQGIRRAQDKLIDLSMR